jgi:membrane protein implicated in regulation of membrane protease activity
MLNFSPVEIWFFIGIALIMIEFFIPAIGFLFIGFGALINAIAIYYYPGLVEYQISSLGIISLFCFLVLWWPLKIFVYGQKGEKANKKEFFEVVGNRVVVCKAPLHPGQSGQVAWSGTIMNARLAENEQKIADVGQNLYVKKIEGNVLICSYDKN